MYIFLLLLIPYLFLCRVTGWCTAIVLPSCLNLMVYAWHQNAKHNLNLLSFAMMVEENREKVPEKSISIMYFTNNYIKLFYPYNANNKYSNFHSKISQIVTKMDFLYV
jgi:hypothetical protein